MSTHQEQYAAAVEKIKRVFSFLDHNSAIALFMTDGVRRQVQSQTASPVDDKTALVGMHLARVELGRVPRSAQVYDISPEDVERSIKFIRESGVKTRLGDL